MPNLLAEARRKKAEEGQQPGLLAEARAKRPEAVSVPQGQAALVSAGRGVSNTVEGVRQIRDDMGARGFPPLGISPEAFAGIEEVERERMRAAAERRLQDQSARRQQEDAAFQPIRDQYPVTSTLAEIGGEIGSTPIPGPAAAAGRLGKLAGGAAQGAAAAGVQYVPEGESRGANAALGGGMGVAGQALGDLVVLPLANRFRNAGMGEFADDGAREIVAAGDRWDIPVFYDDASGNQVARDLSTMAEWLGRFGTGQRRKDQADALAQAAEDFTDHWNVGRTDDAAQAIQNSLRSNLERLQGEASKRYTRVAQATGNEVVPLTQTQNLVDRLIEGESRFGALSDQRVLNVLGNFKDAPDLNFSGLHELRSRISRRIDDYYRGDDAALGSQGVRALIAVRNSISKDMERFAKNKGGDAFSAWKEADTFYREKLAPFRVRGLSDLPDTAEPESIYRRMVRTNVGSRARRLYDALDEKGRAAVRYAAVRDAVETSTSEDGVFNPRAFANRMKKLRQSREVFFKGADGKELDGFIKLMGVMDRAYARTLRPPTGQQVIPMLMVGGAAVEPLTFAQVLAGAQAMRYLFTMESGRNFLLAASDARPGSEAMNEAVQGIGNVLIRAGVLGQTSSGQTQAPPQ